MHLSLRNIQKHYAGAAALNGVDLDIVSGELIALLGPSGSGKTTLLRIIAGLLSPDGGTVRFGDRDATRLSLRERNVGFVFQHYALFRHMTVAENIAFGLRSRPRARRPDKATIARRVDELLQLIQLPDYGGRHPEQLSGGQKQRIALARALAIDPSVLLLDEPFGALDAKVRVELRRWLRRLHDQTGQTTVFVTHDQEEALELADRVVVLREGRIEQVGTPDDIYAHPASAYVFDFIGRGNAIRGHVRSGVFVADDEIGVLDAPGIADGATLAMFRPHQGVRNDEEGEGIRARVSAVHRRADRITVELAPGGGVRPIEWERVVEDDIALPAIGEALVLRPTRPHFFPLA
ncbi:MAG: sulfate/molybdate ABC transporter ATP-binding protein [Xanthomonadaceae bacterium]|nr:sulfate/molybdate ABC transporter ATP-binding protein [Xanthomonadaceae bacterium]